MELTRKLLDSTSSVTADQRIVTVICSTGDPDRAGDVIVQSGIDLTAYRRNPIVLWGHSADVPIARAIEIGVKNGKLQATVQFPPAGDDEDSDWVYGKIKAGIVNATSVGFIPVDYEPLDAKEPWSGYRFKRSELLEFSFVSVPANAGCLIVGRSLVKGVDIPLLPSMVRSRGGAPPVTRAGRTISGANEALLREAMDHHASATKCMREAMDHHASATKLIEDVLDNPKYGDDDNDDVKAAARRRAARAFAPVDGLEKRAARLREAEAIVANTKLLIASIGDDVPLTRDQRIAQALRLRRTLKI